MSVDPSPLRIIGAVAPSSYWLASAMTRFVTKRQGAKRILEIGAGTGAITKVLLGKMKVGQVCDIVEIFPKLAALLTLRFSRRTSVAIHCVDIRSFKADAGYDLIICSLPFNAFLPETTRDVIDRLVELSNHLAVVSFFEYRILHKVAPLMLNKKSLERFYQSRAVIDQFIGCHKFDEQVVNLNIPPAVVHYLCIDKRITKKNHPGV